MNSSEEFTMTIKQEEEWTREMLDEGTSIMIICTAGDEAIAITDTRGGYRQRNTHIASVAKVWSAKGIGKSIMIALVSWAKENNIL